MSKVWSVSAVLLLLIYGITSFADSSYLSEFNIPQAPFQDLRHNVVLGGVPVTNEGQTWKFTVRLIIEELDGKSISTCTGFLISKDLIMTSGHCLRRDNIQVRVLFGRGGPAGFTHKIVSREFRSTHMGTVSNQPSRWKDGFMPFNQKYHDDYMQTLASRQSFDEASNQQINLFVDLALIKINAVPEGYGPVRFYSGPMPEFRNRVIGVGYGTNSRFKEKQDDVLRWAPMELVGRNMIKNKVYGWESYGRYGSSPGPCSGDSGSPLLIYNSGEYQVLGVHTFGFNNCSAGRWSLNPHYFKDLILDMVADLRSTVHI